MNTSFGTLKFHSPAVGTSAPASIQPSRLRAWGTALWAALEGVGRSRARRELLALAARWETTKPELAAQLRAAWNDPVNG